LLCCEEDTGRVADVTGVESELKGCQANERRDLIVEIFLTTQGGNAVPAGVGGAGDPTPPAGAGGAPGAGAAEAVKPRAASRSKKTQGKAESLKLIAGLIAVGIGVVVVGAIAVVALLESGEETAAQIASSAGGVIATIVGAYFGVKIGSDQTKTAIEGQQKEAAKAQAFAAHVPADKAAEAIGLAEQAAENAVPS
jgi:hypothetical protein